MTAQTQKKYSAFVRAAANRCFSSQSPVPEKIPHIFSERLCLFTAVERKASKIVLMVLAFMMFMAGRFPPDVPPSLHRLLQSAPHQPVQTFQPGRLFQSDQRFQSRRLRAYP